MHCSRNRFEWDLSLEEAQRRKLEAYVKNSVSFMSRGEPIGKVWNTAIAVLVPLTAAAAGGVFFRENSRHVTFLCFSSSYTLTFPKRTSPKVLPSGKYRRSIVNRGRLEGQVNSTSISLIGSKISDLAEN